MDIDITDIEIEIKIKRFEQDLFELNPDSIAENLPFLKRKYGLFFELFNTNIIRIGELEHPSYSFNLKHFIIDPDIRTVYDDCMNQYLNMEDLTDDLTNAFKHYKYYFPDKPVPEFFTFISGFNYSIISADSILGIGLDMYLGADYKYYSMLGYPKYKTKNMRRECIVSDCIRGWSTTEFGYDDLKKELLSQMIDHGKILYFMDAMLTDVEDSIKIGYTSEQMSWCRNNESNIWAFFVDKKLLYSTDHKENIKYIGEGPFTTGFPGASPARVGQWLGWQIVRSFMDNNEEVTLRELMTGSSAKFILTKSKYKPGK